MSKGKLELALEQLDKRFGKGAVIDGNTLINIERQKTGSLGLDIITGGGWGKGKIVEIYAPESSGKSSVCIHTMVQAQKDQPNKRVALIDTEHAFDKNYAKNLGLDVDKLLISQPDSGEQALEIAELLIDSGEVSVLVIDSVAALTPQAEIDGEMGESKMGLHARLMSQALRKMTAKISKANTVCIFTNQLRDKIGVMYGCLHADMPIVFTDGRVHTIREVVDKQIHGDVYTYNEELRSIEAKPIIGWHHNGYVSSEEDFIHIETTSIDGRGRFGITVTPDHLIMTDKGWKKAKDISFEDKLMSKYTSAVTGELEDFLKGVLVGDSYLKIRYRNTAYLTLQDSKNKEYLNWKLNILPFNFTEASDGKGGYKFRSDSNYELAKIKSGFKNRNPLDIFNNGVISDISLAVWIMDDGHYKSSHNSYSISVKRFAKNKDVLEGICDIFKNSGLDCNYSLKDGNISFRTSSTNDIVNRISKYFVDSMSYKLPHGTKYGGAKIVNNGVVLKEEFVEITKIRNASNRQLRQKGKYDISVEGNHNYFSGGVYNGVLVHNSPEVTTGGNALKFYASIRVDMRRKQGDKNSEGDVVNNHVTVKTVKNKLASPFQKTEFDIVFGKGIDVYSEIFHYAVQKGFLTKAGSWYSYEDTKIGQGAVSAKEFLADNPELAKELEGKIREAYGI